MTMTLTGLPIEVTPTSIEAAAVGDFIIEDHRGCKRLDARGGFRLAGGDGFGCC